MAITNNPLTKGFRGKIAGMVFRQHLGKTVISDVPDMSKRVLSEKQEANNLVMTEANSYARYIIANEKLRNEAQIRLNVLRNRLYTSLIREYFQNEKNGVDHESIIGKIE